MRIENGELRIENGELKVVGGKLPEVSGRGKVEGGKLPEVSGRGKVEREVGYLDADGQIVVVEDWRSASSGQGDVGLRVWYLEDLLPNARLVPRDALCVARGESDGLAVVGLAGEAILVEVKCRIFDSAYGGRDFFDWFDSPELAFGVDFGDLSGAGLRGYFGRAGP